MSNKRPEQIVFSALATDFENRVYPNVFPLKAPKPVWPAVRVTRITANLAPTIDGDGGDDTADVSLQMDLVAANWAQLVEYREKLKRAMATTVNEEMPTLCSAENTSFDTELGVHRCTLTYDFYPSSDHYLDTGETGAT